MRATHKAIISLIEPTEPVDDCNWGYWSCEYCRRDGTWAEGEIQSDGHEYALETLVDEVGNPVTDL
jgi:hypothetical protein